MRCSNRTLIALFLVISASKAQAGYGGELAAPLLAVGATCLVGSTTLGVALSANGGAIQLLNNDRAVFPIVASALLGVCVAGTVTTAALQKELMNQLKVDHDTYLAGGEMTPILQNLYREVRSRSQELQLKDGPCVGDEIDEGKMTQAIDKLVALAGNP